MTLESGREDPCCPACRTPLADDIAASASRGFALARDELLAVAPDGTTYHLRYGMSVRVVAPDGQLLHITDAARRRDADAAKSRAAQD
jgi:hypothetical protein